ncbi:MAG: electron transfer flavoprotein subunit alpha/FixB family protein [Planctomycetota bacterium]|jgi:electron transfer flavoprotein alpha subunit|nr:electron transfer flavoprotein subunit alpha/FixB family protein [Planctomycetota bacterium]
MMSNILVVLETRDGALRPASLEALGAAHLAANGGTVTALATEQAELDGASLGSAGADRILVADATCHSSDGAAATIARVAQECEAGAVFLMATARGRDLTARIAAALDTGFAADCIAMETSSDGLTFTRPIYGGKALLKLKVNGLPVASLRGNHFAPANRDTNAVIETCAAESGKASVQGVAAKSGDRPDVSEANRVVAGGRGMGDAANWNLLEAIADKLDGAALGASRAVVDSGWRPHGEQVGQTGKTVSPDLYIACGISGAIQHLAGMSSSKCIVAINKDADAPIFQHATFGIVGEVEEVLPALADAL